MRGTLCSVSRERTPRPQSWHTSAAVTNTCDVGGSVIERWKVSLITLPWNLMIFLRCRIPRVRPAGERLLEALTWRTRSVQQGAIVFDTREKTASDRNGKYAGTRPSFKHGLKTNIAPSAGRINGSTGPRLTSTSNHFLGYSE